MGFHAAVAGQASCFITAVTDDVVVIGYANQLHIRRYITSFLTIAEVVDLNRLAA